MTILTAPRISRLMAALVVVGLLILTLLWVLTFYQPEPRVPQRTTIIHRDQGSGPANL